jgi:hypothetical protein
MLFRSILRGRLPLTDRRAHYGGGQSETSV